MYRTPLEIMYVVEGDFVQSDNGMKTSQNIENKQQLINKAERHGLDIEVANKLGVADYKKDSLQTFSDTLTIIDDGLFDIDYTIIKDCNTVLHSPHDVDVAIRDKDLLDAISSLQDAGYVVEKDNKTEIRFSHPELNNVDIYTRLDYFGERVIEIDYILNSTKRVESFGTEYTALEDPVEYALNLSHLFLDHGRATLLDIVHMIRLKKEDTYQPKLAQQVAYEHNWIDEFNLMENDINYIINSVHNGERLRFPYVFPIQSRHSVIQSIKSEKLEYIDLFSILLTTLKARLENTVVESVVIKNPYLKQRASKLVEIVKQNRGDRSVK